ncbi:outer membrane protein [Labrys monachus]|uniref:Outer membrane immunogenic protein n=1 Tax=Labrys monachus TaxID=217067 RepID=A0ABU0FDZ5_9HYPH|nr:outer membrane protein [Labrys monachus]MDQ0392522.1 outer membrane immunogenic protein [Labrys monachus]
MKIRLALAALLLTSTSAFAADLAPQSVEPAAPIAAPVFSWTGFYAGVHAGAVFGDAKSTDSEFGIRAKFNNTGFIGGAHAGYNEEFDNNVVIGLEGDIDYTSLSKTTSQTVDGTFGSAKFKSDWQGSVRARAGYAFDQILPYVTGGVAFADEKLSVEIPGTGSDSSSKTRVGWTAGAGVEYAIDQNWIVRGEVRYTDFGKQNMTLLGDRVKTRFNETTTELGVSYKF